MRRIPGTFAILLFVCGLSAPPDLAQFLSAIEGKVVDNTGAAVPGARSLLQMPSLAYQGPAQRTRVAS
jgi:hypothetical protein